MEENIRTKQAGYNQLEKQRKHPNSALNLKQTEGRKHLYAKTRTGNPLSSGL